MIVVSAEQKTPSGEAPHYAEDEGLYVGERPRVNWTNQVVVENRLLKRRDKVREVNNVALISRVLVGFLLMLNVLIGKRGECSWSYY